MFEDIVNGSQEQDKTIKKRLNMYSKDQLNAISKNSRVIILDAWRNEIKKLCAELVECYNYIDDLRK